MSWILGLDSWIIQDGNYGDFERGQEVELAVEFYAPRGARRTSSSAIAVRPTGPDAYDVVARVVLAAPAAPDAPQGVSVIDIGISAYQEGVLMPKASAGDFVALELELGVDPFMYFERLHRLEGMPPLVYTWTIGRIERQTAPFVEVKPRVFERDRSKWAWAETERTDAWNDDDGHGTYRLHCDLLDVPPRTRSRTAIY